MGKEKADKINAKKATIHLDMANYHKDSMQLLPLLHSS